MIRHFLPYFGILAAFWVVLLAANLSSDISLRQSAPTHVASSTLSVGPGFSGFSLPLLTLPEGKSATSTATTSETQQETPSPNKSTPPLKKPASVSTPTTPVAVTVPVPAQTPLPAPSNAELDAAASLLRAALVNIICTVPAASGLHSISGSGIFVDPKGIILTNAHIAQYFLLADRGAVCTIRSGSPAVERYSAALMYISPLWLRANASVITQKEQSGTGEYDFALLAVSKSANRDALPDTFPSIPLAIAPVTTLTPVVIASYGAQFLDSSQIQSNLFPIVVFGSVKDVFTFAINTIDVLALGGSAAAQEGSSGGGVANAFGKLVGSITTSTVTGDTASRSLHALTASYIRAQYANETGSAIDLLLERPIATSLSTFAQKIPELGAIITAQLP